MPTLKLARTAVFSWGSGGERPQRQAETRTTEECVPCSSCCRNKQHLCATSDTTSERLVPDRRACATGGHPGGVGARSRRGRRCPPGCCAFGSASPLPTSTPVPGERPQARVSELLRTWAVSANKDLFQDSPLTLRGAHPEEGLLDSAETALFSAPSSDVRGLQSLPSLQHLSSLSMGAVTVTLLCISLLIRNVLHLFGC